MSRIELAAGVADDLERILDHLSDHEVEDPAARIGEIIDAIGVLGSSPLIGRPAAGDLRELIIGRRSHGYVVRRGRQPDPGCGRRNGTTLRGSRGSTTAKLILAASEATIAPPSPRSARSPCSDSGRGHGDASDGRSEARPRRDAASQVAR